MAFLRRVLYFQALVAAVVGAALALFPAFVLETLLDQPPLREYAWVRILGVESVGAALLMVLVGHRADELWWWSWAFVISTAGVAGVFTLNAAFGLEPGAPAWGWWVLAGISWAFASGLVLAMSRAAQERPPI